MQIVAVSERPDLAPLIARWRVEAFFQYPGGYTIEAMTARILAPDSGPRESFMLFADGEPAGTAGLVRSDLESRQDLTPWLAGVFVPPDFRGRGHASALVRRVEAFARDAGLERIWLYTSSASGLYRGLGWQHAGEEQDHGRTVALMCRDLTEG